MYVYRQARDSINENRAWPRRAGLALRVDGAGALLTDGPFGLVGLVFRCVGGFCNVIGGGGFKEDL